MKRQREIKSMFVEIVILSAIYENIRFSIYVTLKVSVKSLNVVYSCYYVIYSLI